MRFWPRRLRVGAVTALELVSATPRFVSYSSSTHKPFDVDVDDALGAFDGTCDASSEETAVLLDRALGVTASRCSSQRTTASFGSLAAVAICNSERVSNRTVRSTEGCEKAHLSQVDECVVLWRLCREHRMVVRVVHNNLHDSVCHSWLSVQGLEDQASP